MRAIQLGVNIDHVATLRQVRLAPYPEPLHAALLAEQAGADSITVHLREDRRHIQERDVIILKDTICTPLNLEMAVTDEMLAFAESLRPAFCCLVPERREELTTEGGLDVAAQSVKVGAACRRLKAAGIRVSLFIDPEPDQLQASRDCEATVVEIHTGRYGSAGSEIERERELGRIIAAARSGVELGMQINAGHGLNYRNVQPVAAIPEIDELNIGHSIVARALFTGLSEAVAEMKRLMRQAQS